mgnify:FL=1
MMRIIFFSSAAAAQQPGAVAKWFASMQAKWQALAETLRRVIGLVTGLLALAAGALVFALLP